MDVKVAVTVGNFCCEACVVDCGPDALGDALHQVTTHTLAMIGGETCVAAATPIIETDAS